MASDDVRATDPDLAVERVPGGYRITERRRGPAATIDITIENAAVVGHLTPCAETRAPSPRDRRERLTEVERLLAKYVSAVETGDIDAEMGRPDPNVVEALAKVRSLLGRS